MACERAHEQIALFVYSETDEKASRYLQHHLDTCPECREELQAMRSLAAAMSLLPVREPSANLLAHTRLRVAEALDEVPQRTWLARLRQSLGTDFNIMRTAPLSAAALLFAGIALGAYGGHSRVIHRHPAPAPGAAAPTAPVVAEVNSVTRQPQSGLVKVSYGKVVPATAQGAPDDPFIRQLLLMGARNRVDPAVQNDAVDLLADACLHGQACEQDAVRHALLVALRYDPNAEVRHKALSGLEPYVAEDTHVRDAVLEAVLDDRDPGVRSEAVGMLQPVGRDSSVQEVLHTVAAQHGNPHLQTVSREMLDQTSQIQ